MSYFKIVLLAGVVVALGSSTVLASCSNSGYGSNNCDDNKTEYSLEKKVSKSDSSSKSEKIFDIRKGDNFIFSFKITNNTDEEVTLKLVDNLPSEFERVSGIGFTEEVKVAKNSSETVKMVAKVKDSEFEAKKDFEKCVINKAYIYKNDRQKDSSTATVCFGDGAKLTVLPKTGADSIVAGVGVFTTLLGLGLRRFRK
jgi:hypothetical protein